MREMDTVYDEDGRELWTVARAARESGIVRSTFRAYVARGQAPAAVARLNGSGLWDAEEILSWAKGRFRR